MGDAQKMLGIVIISHLHLTFLANWNNSGKHLASVFLFIFFSTWESLPQSLSRSFLLIPQILL